MQNKPGKTYYVTAEDFDDAVYDCTHTKYVRDNDRYSDAAKGVHTFMESNDDTVNACAFRLDDMTKTWLKMVEPSVDWDGYQYGMLMYGGILRWLTVIGHVSEYFARTANVSGARKMLKWMGDNAIDGECGSDFVKRFLHEFKNDTEGVRVEQTRVYALAALRSVVAHELGHVCLGHCNNISDQRSLRRNDEREADLFASSIAQSMANGLPSVIGTTMVEISFTWLSRSNKPNMFGDHPNSLERVRNFIESFNAMLIGHKVTAEALTKLCR